MHDKDNKDLEIRYLVKYSYNDFSQRFWIFASLCRTIGNSMIPMRQDIGSVNDAWLSNSCCCTVGNSVITVKTKDLHSQ